MTETERKTAEKERVGVKLPTSDPHTPAPSYDELKLENSTLRLDIERLKAKLATLSNPAKLSEKAQNLLKFQEEQQNDITVLQNYWESMFEIPAPSRRQFLSWYNNYGFIIVRFSLDATLQKITIDDAHKNDPNWKSSPDYPKWKELKITTEDVANYAGGCMWNKKQAVEELKGKKNERT
jgi:hypothetical protein